MRSPGYLPAMLLLALLPAAQAAIELPFTQLETGHVIIPVTLDGVTTPFVLDTGASATVVLPATWDAAGHDSEHGMVVGGKGAGGSVQGVRLIKLPTLGIGGQDVKVGYAVVMDVAAVAPVEGGAPQFGGILGVDVLQHYVVELDFGAHVLKLYGPDEAAPVAKAWTPTRRLRGGLMGIDLKLAGATIPAVLDLGATGTILNTAAAALPGVTKVDDCGSRAFGADEHELTLDCVTVEDLAVQSRDFGATALSVADLPIFQTMRLATKHGKPSPAAIFGVDLLGQDVLILDAAGKRFGWR